MPTSSETYLVWVDHPNMRPMTLEEMLTHWTTMPRPLPSQAEALRRVEHFRRRGMLVEVDAWLR